MPSGNSQLFQTRVVHVEDLPYIYIYMSILIWNVVKSEHVMDKCVYIYICAETFAHLNLQTFNLTVYIYRDKIRGMFRGDVLSVVFPR